MAQISRKLEPDPARPRYFVTEARMGYRFEVDDPKREGGASGSKAQAADSASR